MTMMQSTGIRRELEAAPFGAAGASLRQAVDWRSIKWKRANRNVRRLQRRIVQAQQQGKKRKVRALSRCPTSGGKPRSAHSRRGRAKTRHAREESSGRGKTQRRRISTAAPQARLHRQEEREGPSPPRNSNYG